jgi:hypothetical protein
MKTQVAKLVMRDRDEPNNNGGLFKMKVYIGPYRNRWNSCVHDRHMMLKYGLEWSENQDWEDRAWERAEDTLQWVYNHTINLYLDKCEPKISVKIHKYDTWSMDTTLAHIIVPMLKQLKATKHGSPYVDDSDVPEHLRNNSPKDKEFWNGDVDDNHHVRWAWILDEMIWAFEQSAKGDWEAQYYKFEDCEPNPDAKTFYEKLGTKLVWEDPQGRKAHQKRMTNGFRLFGKYYQALWD